MSAHPSSTHATVLAIQWKDAGITLLIKRHRLPKSQKTNLNHFVILI